MNSVRQNTSIREDIDDYSLATLGLHTSVPDPIHSPGFVTRPSHAGLLTGGKLDSGLSFSSGIDLEALSLSEEPGWYLTSKRLGDVTAAAAALILLFPLMAVIALLVYGEDGGPALYHQERIGKNGRRFKFYKFRSMVRNADVLKAEIQAHNEATGPIFKMKNDPRVTRIGRTLRRYSLDELPQLWNVIAGDMSLVGPRPHLPTEVAQYRSSQKARLTVQPGLICLREVSGRSRLSFEQWVELDLVYIRKRSLGLDLRILWMAIPAVLRADGAF